MYYIFYLFIKCIIIVCLSFESVSDSRAEIFVLFTDVHKDHMLDTNNYSLDE